MSGLDAFWAGVDRMLLELREAKTADDVIRICPPSQYASGHGFFPGGGGDDLPDDSLLAAGWSYVWSEASYFWCMAAPDGKSFVEYVEGDLYSHTTAPRPPAHGEGQ